MIISINLSNPTWAPALSLEKDPLRSGLDGPKEEATIFLSSRKAFRALDTNGSRLSMDSGEPYLLSFSFRAQSGFLSIEFKLKALTQSYPVKS